VRDKQFQRDKAIFWCLRCAHGNSVWGEIQSRCQ
jgi:hypothetical protein